MQDDHVVTSDFVENEIIPNRHHPVVEVVSGRGEALWKILQRKAGEIQFGEKISSRIRACGLAGNECLYFNEIMVAPRGKNDPETHSARRSIIWATVKYCPRR